MNKSIAINGKPVRYIEYGAGPAILCLHGAMGGADQSEILGKTIGPESHRYICLSRPGYPGTPITHGKSPNEQAQFIYHFLQAIDVEKVIIIAISGGGFSAIHFAATYPETCEKLILCSTTAQGVESKIPFSFHIMNFLTRYPLIRKAMKKGMEKNFDKSLPRSIYHPDILAEFLQNNDAYQLFKEMSVGMFDDMQDRFPGTYNDILQTRKIEFPLNEISVPTLVVHGEDDTMVNFERHGKKLAEEIKGARTCFIKKGEHVSIFTHRTIVQKAVREFLA